MTDESHSALSPLAHGFPTSAGPRLLVHPVSTDTDFAEHPLYDYRSSDWWKMAIRGKSRARLGYFNVSLGIQTKSLELDSSFDFGNESILLTVRLIDDLFYALVIPLGHRSTDQAN